MSNPSLLARTDAEMLVNLNIKRYFTYIIRVCFQPLGTGSRDTPVFHSDRVTCGYNLYYSSFSSGYSCRTYIIRYCHYHTIRLAFISVVRSGSHRMVVGEVADIDGVRRLNYFSTGDSEGIRRNRHQSSSFDQ